MPTVAEASASGRPRLLTFVEAALPDVPRRMTSAALGAAHPAFARTLTPRHRVSESKSMTQQQRTITALHSVSVPGVTHIAVSPDGLDVVFLGPVTTVEVSLACQEVLESVRDVVGPDVAGGFIARAPEVFPDYQPVTAHRHES